MDAIKLLEQQHREVEDLFEDYEGAEGSGQKRGVFARIADNLAAHATIEEKIFYPSVYVGELKDKLREAVEEHLAAKRIIADLLDMDPNEANFDAKVKVLQEQIEHHVEEEEGDLFLKVRANFAAQELSLMGEKMEESFEALIQTSPRNQVPNETDQAAPLT